MPAEWQHVRWLPAAGFKTLRCSLLQVWAALRGAQGVLCCAALCCAVRFRAFLCSASSIGRVSSRCVAACMRVTPATLLPSHVNRARCCHICAVPALAAHVGRDDRAGGGTGCHWWPVPPPTRPQRVCPLGKQVPVHSWAACTRAALSLVRSLQCAVFCPLSI